MQLIRVSLALPASIGSVVSSIAHVLHVSQTPQPALSFRGMSSNDAAVKPHPVFHEVLPVEPYPTVPVEEEYVHGPHGPHRALGLSRPLYALIFGILSGVSLPLGALLGIKWSPVQDHYCAAMMAFGAGCLLFAVTVELYAHALHELAHGNIGYMEMGFQTLGALCGAYFYVWINHWLETEFGEPHEVNEPHVVNADVPFSRNISESSAGSDLNHKSPRSEGPDSSCAARVFTQRYYQAVLKMKRSDTPTEVEPTAKQKAQGHWKSLRTAFRLRNFMEYWQKQTLGLKGVRGREVAMRLLANEVALSKGPGEGQKETEARMAKAKMVALALFIGLLVDGVPEGILVGFLSAEGHFTPVLIISLLLANFPEAFSSASLMISAGMSTPVIVGMWGGLCALVGCLSGASCWILLALYPSFGLPGVELPDGVLVSISLVEGITGGAMIACISSVMMPEAFERTKKDGPLGLSSGFLCTVGFLVATVLKAVGG